jgi:hypothetical protein
LLASASYGHKHPACTDISQLPKVFVLISPRGVLDCCSSSLLALHGSGSLVTVANGSMGAAGVSLTYQESISFTQIGGIFALVLLSSDVAPQILPFGFRTKFRTTCSTQFGNACSES